MHGEKVAKAERGSGPTEGWWYGKVALMLELTTGLNLVNSNNYSQQSIHFETCPTCDAVGDRPVLTKLIHLQSHITVVTNTYITYRVL